MDIVVDFDGTCVTHSYPYIGKDIGAIPVLKRLTDAGHNLILFTMRSDSGMKDVPQPEKRQDQLTQAVNWFIDNDIPLYGVQKNPTQHTWTTSPKAYGQVIIDDAAIGCPLNYDGKLSNRPFVDWKGVEELLTKKGLL